MSSLIPKIVKEEGDVVFINFFEPWTGEVKKENLKIPKEIKCELCGHVGFFMSGFFVFLNGEKKIVCEKHVKQEDLEEKGKITTLPLFLEKENTSSLPALFRSKM